MVFFLRVPATVVMAEDEVPALVEPGPKDDLGTAPVRQANQPEATPEFCQISLLFQPQTTNMLQYPDRVFHQE